MFCSQHSEPDTLSFMGTDLDATDWAIISEIQRDARLSFNQIAKRVNLSAPSVAARIRRLEESPSEQEMEIRKQLKLLKPGETTFILPDGPKDPDK